MRIKFIRDDNFVVMQFASELKAEEVYKELNLEDSPAFIACYGGYYNSICIPMKEDSI